MIERLSLHSGGRVPHQIVQCGDLPLQVSCLSINAIISHAPSLAFLSARATCRRRVRLPVTRAVRQHVKHQWKDEIIDESFLRELPRALRNEVLRDINMKVLCGSPLVVSCDKR